MCRIRRSTDDPLLRRFFDRYGLHLLARPRQGMDVGAVVITRRDASATAGSLAGMVTPPVDDLRVTRDEVMVDVQGTLSHGVDVEVGASICEAFVAALGVVGIGVELHAAGRRHRDARMHFSFAEPTRDSVDPQYMAGILLQRRRNDAHPLYDADSRYYVVTAVARSHSLQVGLTTVGGGGIDVGAELEGLGSIGSEVTIERADHSTLRFSNHDPVAFGVELFELTFDEVGRPRLRLPPQAVKVRSGDRSVMIPEPAVIGGEDAPAFLELAPSSSPHGPLKG